MTILPIATGAAARTVDTSTLTGAPITPLTVALSLIRWSTAGITSEQTFLQETVRTVARALRVPLCKVLELDSRKEWLLVRAGFGLDETATGNVWVTTQSSSHAGLALCLGSPVVCADLPATAHFRDAAVLRRHGAVSGVATRIGTADAPFGILTVHTTSRREFTEDEVQFLNKVAFALAQGIRHRRVDDAGHLALRGCAD